MKESDVHSELASIRSIMERSSKFISLSGLSGVMAGVYALLGAFLGYQLIQGHTAGLGIKMEELNDPQIWEQLVSIALAVLLFSLATCLILTQRQSNKKGEKFWNPGSKRLVTAMVIPLLTGGMFISILLFKADYSLVIPSALLFYGLSLVSGSQYTFSDIKWLGICELVLGLLCTLIPAYGLLFWVIGFGLLHVLYGSIMHFKYKQ